MSEEGEEFGEDVIAYHEAGHAVMCHLTGCDMACVTVEPNPERGNLGEVGHAAPPRYQIAFPSMVSPGDVRRFDRREEERALRANVRVILAGPLAEVMHTGETFNERHLAEVSEARALAGARKRNPTRYLLDQQVLCQNALKRSWRAVESLAAALMDRKTIDGGEAARIIEAALTPKK